MRATFWGIVLAVLLILTSGCQTKPRPGLTKLKRTETAEYNCLEHARDNICEVPVNGKVVLYCVKGLKRIVHYREDCK